MGHPTQGFKKVLNHVPTFSILPNVYYLYCYKIRTGSGVNQSTELLIQIAQYKNYYNIPRGGVYFILSLWYVLRYAPLHAQI